MNKANEFRIHSMYAGTEIEKVEPCPYAFSALWMEYLFVTQEPWEFTTIEAKRRAVYARRKLIEFGKLIKYKHKDKVLAPRKDTAPGDDVLYEHRWVNRTYTTPQHAESLQFFQEKKEAVKNLEQGHHFVDGERIFIEIQEVDRFDFETEFGKTFVVTYSTHDNKMLKYIGSKPPEIEPDELVQVKATIKHKEYRGELETRIQRIKITSTH